MIQRFLSTGWYLAVLATYIIGQLGVWRLDNAVPIEVTGPIAEMTVRAGDTLKVVVPIIRTSTRECGLLYSRYLEDSAGTYHDIMATRFAAPKARAARAGRNPHELNFSIRIPENSAPGYALIVTQHAYMCNPLQSIWPIDLEIIVKVLVLP